MPSATSSSWSIANDRVRAANQLLTFSFGYCTFTSIREVLKTIDLAISCGQSSCFRDEDDAVFTLCKAISSSSVKQNDAWHRFLRMEIQHTKGRLQSEKLPFDGTVGTRNEAGVRLRRNKANLTPELQVFCKSTVPTRYLAQFARQITHCGYAGCGVLKCLLM